MAGPPRLEDAGATIRKGEKGKDGLQAGPIEKAGLNTERDGGLSGSLEIIALRRRDDDAADLAIEVDAAVAGDLAITADRTVGEQRPIAVGIDGTGDAPSS